GFFGLYTSTDNGTTWIESDSGLKGRDDVYSILIGSKYMFATTDYGLFRSADDGVSWQQIDSGGIMPGRLVYKNDTLFGVNNNGVYFSMDDGDTWVESDSGVTGLKYAVGPLFVTGNSVFVCGYGTICRSIDNGHSWKNVSTGLPGGTETN